MGTVTNPLYTNQVPTNPTGQQIAVPGSPSSSGSNPLLPNPGTSATAPTSTNPLAAGFPANSGGGYTPTNLAGGAVPGATPKTNAGQAAASPIGGLNTMSPKDISKLFDGLKKSYGDGPAHAILDFLTSGAGFNQDAINNMLAALQPGVERGTQSVLEQFGASGNRFGSGAQIGVGDFLSQVNLNEGQLETKMYEDSINRYMEVLMGTGKQIADTTANSPSTMDSIMSAVGLAGSAGQGASALTSAINPGADTGWLDSLAGAAAAI